MTLTEHLRTLPDELPPPASGHTPARFQTLWDIAARSPALGRLAEAHYDGVAILREAGRNPIPGALYAVWAAAGPKPATLRRDGQQWRLTGDKHWCSGASIVTHALVTAAHDDHNALVELDVATVTRHPPSWRSPAFADMDTRTVTFDLVIEDHQIVADDDWYLTRPGFWDGAAGVAACWAGCAAGLVRRVVPSWPDNPHATAHLGAVDAALWALQTLIHQAANEIDGRDSDVADPIRRDDARRRALRVRHLVDSSITTIVDHVTRAIGPAPLAHQTDAHIVYAETDLYRRQCHAERDLEQLGILTRNARR